MISFNPHKKFKGSFNSTRILRIIPWVWLTAGYFFTVAAFCLNGRHLLDSDMSSEMVLASQLNKEGNIFSTNWFYSTELRVFNTQLIYKIGLAFFPDWHMARSFSIAVLLLLFLACYLFLTKELRLGNIGVWTAGALIFPFSAIYENIVLYGCYYIPHISMATPHRAGCH